MAADIMKDPLRRNPLVPVIRLDGVIDAGGRFGRGLNLYDYDAVIEHAFSFKKARAVALCINSPGGSPVQSALLFKRIRQLSEEKKIPVLAFAEDVAASGGYMLALAGDEIFCDESSIMGSIGVVSAGFGFNGLLDKYGVERRVYTAGKNKAGLDPFMPENAEEVEKLKVIQTEVHEHFRQMVRERREGKLKADEDFLFNGDVFAGRKAVDLGLADNLGNMHEVLRERFGKDVRVRYIETRKGFLRSRLGLDVDSVASLLPGFALWGNKPVVHDGVAPDLMEGLLSALERKALWTRFGR